MNTSIHIFMEKIDNKLIYIINLLLMETSLNEHLYNFWITGKIKNGIKVVKKKVTPIIITPVEN